MLEDLNVQDRCRLENEDREMSRNQGRIRWERCGRTFIDALLQERREEEYHQSISFTQSISRSRLHRLSSRLNSEDVCDISLSASVIPSP